MVAISDSKIARTRILASEYLANDKSGHGMDHVERACGLAEEFLEFYPEANRGVVLAAALLDDVDDCKLVGRDQAERHENSTRIMSSVGIRLAD